MKDKTRKSEVAILLLRDVIEETPLTENLIDTLMEKMEDVSDEWPDIEVVIFDKIKKESFLRYLFVDAFIEKKNVVGVENPSKKKFI